ncbi:hypothetical protein [Curtobacterium flaccumfaciens]|uniref:hypothetical protein n=1 Tax=Curtobacterium flaccumfaciens TaxID=2035 RepID=UPI001600BE2E|nr:hypothetical protein [Curtobacterium flaccumfaciens]
MDDERALADLVATGLTVQDMAVDVAYRGNDADELLAVHDSDVRWTRALGARCRSGGPAPGLQAVASTRRT